MTIEAAKKLDHFLCSDCSDDEAKRSQNAFPTSPTADTKVRLLFALGEVSLVSLFTPLNLVSNLVHDDPLFACFLGKFICEMGAYLHHFVTLASYYGPILLHKYEELTNSCVIGLLLFPFKQP